LKKLSKTDEFNRTAYVKALNDAADKVRDALVELNAEIEKANLAISEYNAAVADADEFSDEIVCRMEEYSEDLSEAWHEGGAGQAHREWYNEWYELDLERLDPIEAIDEPDMDHAELLEQLPSEPQS
jgi:uncharacterized protein YukE